MSTINAERPLDEERLMEFVFRAVGEVGATLNAALVVMGDKLGYYRVMASGEPISPAELADRSGTRVAPPADPTPPAELADRSGTAEPYAREWLNAQAAGGYVTYDAVTS